MRRTSQPTSRRKRSPAAAPRGARDVALKTLRRPSKQRLRRNRRPPRCSSNCERRRTLVVECWRRAAAVAARERSWRATAGRVSFAVAVTRTVLSHDDSAAHEGEARALEMQGPIASAGAVIEGHIQELLGCSVRRVPWLDNTRAHCGPFFASGHGNIERVVGLVAGRVMLLATLKAQAQLGQRR